MCGIAQDRLTDRLARSPEQSCPRRAGIIFLLSSSPADFRWDGEPSYPGASKFFPWRCSSTWTIRCACLLLSMLFFRLPFFWWKQIYIFLRYKQAVQKRVQWVSAVKKNAIWAKTHERNARRVLNLMIELEGLWVKMGQYLSTRADVLPEPYIEVLKQLQDSLPPRPLEEVCIYQFIGKNGISSISIHL